MVKRTVLRDICLLLFVALMLFGINNYLAGYAFLGLVDALLAWGMLFNAWRLHRQNTEYSGGLAVLVAGSIAILLAIYTQRYGIFWSYIAVAGAFLVVERRTGAIFSLIFILCVVMLAWQVSGLAISVRVGFTLALLAAFSYIFSYRIEKQNQTLLEYSNDLEKADATKSEFIANMSHEMRTPLTTVLGYAENILHQGHVDSSSKEQLATIVRSAKSLSDMINDILDLTRMESGQISVSPARFALAPFLGELSRVWEREAKEKGLDFLVHVKTPLPRYLDTDAMRLNQILNNLLGNAVKFTATGNVQFSVEYRVGDHKLIFEVADTGIGVASEFRAKLFDKFTQADTSVTRKYGGIGLGLYISKNLAARLEGRLDYRPRDVGSLFQLSLEHDNFQQEWLQEGDVINTGAVVEPQAAKSFSGHVLIAEDSVAVQLLLGLLVEKMGMTYTTVDNGRTAVEMMRDQCFDLVLMDLQMPQISGIDAAREIRTFDRDTPIVALSADVLLGDADPEQLAPFNGLVAKPVQIERLQEIFEELL